MFDSQVLKINGTLGGREVSEIRSIYLLQDVL